MEEEVWKEIEGYTGYQVSNLGRVKSLVKLGRRKERLLKGSPNTTGYMLVQLYNGDGLKSRKSLLVHRLVMLTFQPNEVMDELEVNHIDLNTTNNKMSNLEWVTPQGNKDHYGASDKFIEAIKKIPSGENQHLAVMTDELVIEFRRRWNEVKDIYGQRSKLAREFGIAESTARLITDNKTWKHLL